jgi:TolB-like protein
VRHTFEDFELDPERRELVRNGQSIAMEPQVFDLLLYLIENRHRVVSRDDLIAAVWKGRIVSESALSTRINAVRSAISDSGEEQRLIKTLPRKGVRFVGKVRTDEPKRAAEVTGAIATTVSDPGPSLAVLPFTNMSGDSEQEYFADGMAEEIITSLSRCSSLTVIARNSSFTFKNKVIDIRQVGRELGVRYVLEGSVRRADTRLRIAGQLVDAQTATHIWADRFDGVMSDIFELQDRIAESIVAAIEPSLQLAEMNRAKRKTAASLDAYDLLLRAQQQMYEFTNESLSAALENIRKALALDTAYAPALATGAYCHAQRFFQGWMSNPEEEKRQGLRLAARAVELAKDDASVLCMAAYAVRELGMDPQRSKELIVRSLHLNPNSYLALTIAAWNEIVFDNPTRALELLRKAERLNPRDPRSWFMSNATSLANIARGDYEQAAASARQSLAQNPRSAQALRFLAASLALLGQQKVAAKIMIEVIKIEPGLAIDILRRRVPFMPEGIWNRYAEGLRMAGLPDRQTGIRK